MKAGTQRLSILLDPGLRRGDGAEVALAVYLSGRIEQGGLQMVPCDQLPKPNRTTTCMHENLDSMLHVFTFLLEKSLETN